MRELPRAGGFMSVARAVLVLMFSVVALALLPTPVSAGTPYTCRCEGKTKRFIGGTYFCGHRKPECTYKQYIEFRARACASQNCTVAR
jgi:hypothetical protein